MEDKMLLNEEEKQNILKIQKELKDAMATLGSFRRQIIRNEKNLIEKLDELESEFMTYLRTLAQSRGMPENENWVFDPNTFGFIKS